MPLAGFEPKISAGKRPRSYALDRVDTGTNKIMGSMRVQILKGWEDFCVPTGGGIYIDCGVSKTYGLSSTGDSEGGDGAVGCRCSSDKM
jgi:hypothetical protein